MNANEKPPEQRVEILIAEDSPTQARHLQHILEQAGFRVTAAVNGRLALEAARARKPALIISDVIMPEVGGYELCRNIKTDPNLADIPVILVTTMSSPEDVISGLECRADNLILKPYDARYLLGRVQFVLVNREMRQSDQPGMGLEIFFNGQKHFITADRLQILNLLLSTYDAAMQRNNELNRAHDKLREANTQLQQMALDLENRVAQRTQELAHSNEALRQTQQAVMQQERLLAMGQMASGIAHDINNAISPVTLYTESLLETEPNLSPRARNYLETIQRSIDDVSQTVARMREFYRHKEIQLTLLPVNLNQLVQQVVDLSKVRWSDMPQQKGFFIDLTTDLAANLIPVSGVESEIREALLNLVFNAVDAMPEGGKLLVRTKILQRPEGSETGHDSVAMEVSDTGTGMDEATRRRCLEPFFTTKGERGTGLGLAMVYGIAQRHGAKIEIDSETGRGTTMRLVFPSLPVPVQSPGSAPAIAAPQSPLRILVVDDDAALIKSLRDTLATDGHSVVTAGGGQEGIDTFISARAGNEKFDVVITDLGMPRVDGRKVSSAVKSASPSTPVILLTGWGQRLIDEGDIPPHVDKVLNKPPRLRELREALAACRAAAKT